MSDLLFLFKYFTIFYTSILCFLSFRSVIFFGLKGACLLLILFYFIFIFPYISDYFFNLDFKNFPGFYYSFNDYKTNLIYCVFLIYTSSVLWFFRGKDVFDVKFKKNTKYFDILIFIFSVFPYLFFLFVPNKANYLIYGGDWLRNFNEIDYLYSSYLNILTFISAVLGGYIFVKYLNKNLFFSLVMLMILFFDFYLNGKRGIVILSVIVLSFFSFFYWKKTKSLLFISIILFCLAVFNSWYQSNVRDFDSSVSLVDKYENLRIDYFRDQRVKMAIYAEINPEKINILEYTGQSYLFYLTFFIPRNFWEGKPLPYAQYFTSALYLTEPQMWGWGMSTSIFDEFIANFGLLGILLVPFLLVIILNKSHELNKYFGLYTLFLIVLLFMLQMISFMFLYVGWIFLFSYLSLRRKVAFK